MPYVRVSKQVCKGPDEKISWLMHYRHLALPSKVAKASYKRRIMPVFLLTSLIESGAGGGGGLADQLLPQTQRDGPQAKELGLALALLCCSQVAGSSTLFWQGLRAAERP